MFLGKDVCRGVHIAQKQHRDVRDEINKKEFSFQSVVSSPTNLHSMVWFQA